MNTTDDERDTLEAWLWSWYDRTAGPSEDWTWGDLRDALLESDWLAEHDRQVSERAWSRGRRESTDLKSDAAGFRVVARNADNPYRVPASPDAGGSDE